MQNKQVRLIARPSGNAKPTDFETTIAEIAKHQNEGDVLVKIEYLSIDPAMRGWMNEGKSYVPPVELGAIMRAGGAGRIIASSNEKYKIGEYVTGMFGIQEYFIAHQGKGLNKVDTTLAPLQTYLNTLGMTGMSAYFCLLEVGQPKEGETVVVSGAAGAVGSIAGQIAKAKGCRVVGIAGGADKCKYLVDELGFDAAIDYKAGNLRKELKAACPNGIDVYFDNVGGEILDTVLGLINLKARIAICGAISQYNSSTGVKGPANYLSLLVNRARMEGFVVLDWTSRFGEAAKEMAGLMKAGKLKSKETIAQGGVDKYLDTLMILFEGDKIGKLLLKV